MAKTISAAQVAAKIKQTPDDSKVRDLVWSLSGDDMRFLRQALMLELKGEKLPIAKCGVTALTAAALEYRDSQPAQPAEVPATAKKAEEQPVDGAALVGASVVRKCGTKGKIEAFVDGKFFIQLENGTKKSPGLKLFKANYKCMQAEAVTA